MARDDHPAAEWDGTRPAWVIVDSAGRFQAISQERSEAIAGAEHDLCPQDQVPDFQEQPMSALGRFVCKECAYAPCVAHEVVVRVKR